MTEIIDKTYGEEVAKEILRRVVMGRTIKSILDDDDMPDADRFYAWLGRGNEVPGMRSTAALIGMAFPA